MCKQRRLSRVCALSESDLICVDFYNTVRNQSIFFTYYMYSKNKVRNTYKKVYENINFTFFENKKSSISVLKFLIARLQWIGILVRTFRGPKMVK